MKYDLRCCDFHIPDIDLRSRLSSVPFCAAAGRELVSLIPSLKKGGLRSKARITLMTALATLPSGPPSSRIAQ